MVFPGNRPSASASFEVGTRAIGELQERDNLCRSRVGILEVVPRLRSHPAAEQIRVGDEKVTDVLFLEIGLVVLPRRIEDVAIGTLRSRQRQVTERHQRLELVREIIVPSGSEPMGFGVPQQAYQRIVAVVVRRLARPNPDNRVGADDARHIAARGQEV